MKAGLPAMFLFAACIEQVNVARDRAVSDLTCPAEQISTYEAIDGSTVAQGCGAWTQYECFYTRSRGVVCVREAPAQLNASPPAPAPAPKVERQTGPFM